jgi:hypothetical protein
MDNQQKVGKLQTKSLNQVFSETMLANIHMAIQCFVQQRSLPVGWFHPETA